MRIPNPSGSGFVEASQSARRFRFEYARLAEKGFAELAGPSIDLMVTLRGTGMLDVFDRTGWRHAAFLDFDLQRAIHLDTAFGSPFIGLPFTAGLRQTCGIALEGFADLRRRHHYGFFIHPAYRNKGLKHVWNLDELMMAVALSHAENSGLLWFTVRPTGDTTPYYIRKYAAVRRPTGWSCSTSRTAGRCAVSSATSP